MFHEITLIGRLGQAPELRFTQDGTPVANLSVAVNNVYTKGNGEKVEETRWFRVSVWRRQAETCAEYLGKGDQVFIKGSLSGQPRPGGDPSEPVIEPRVWEDQSGEPRASFEVNGRFVRFLGGGGNGGSTSPASEPAEAADIPF